MVTVRCDGATQGQLNPQLYQQLNSQQKYYVFTTTGAHVLACSLFDLPTYGTLWTRWVCGGNYEEALPPRMELTPSTPMKRPTKPPTTKNMVCSSSFLCNQHKHPHANDENSCVTATTHIAVGTYHLGGPIGFWKAGLNLTPHVLVNFNSLGEA
mgnify:CR=1 FL=1